MRGVSLIAAVTCSLDNQLRCRTLTSLTKPALLRSNMISEVPHTFTAWSLLWKTSRGNGLSHPIRWKMSLIINFALIKELAISICLNFLIN